MSNLSLVTLGGMLTLGGTIYGDSVSPRQLGLAAFLVICAGVLATKGAIDIVRRRGTARAHSRLSKAFPALVAGSYGGGIGAFLFVLLSSAW